MATVPISTRSNRFVVASTSAGPFAVGFRMFDNNTLDVFVNGVRTTAYTLNVTYAFGFSDTATITFNAPVAAGQEVRIEGALSPRREDDYLPGDANLTDKLNIEFGRIWSSLSELYRTARRSIRSFDELDPVEGVDLDAIINAESYALTAQTKAAEAAASASAAAAAQNTILKPKGQWLTATSYVLGDLVYQLGSQYECISAHTSGTFATDLSAAKWRIFVAQGASGPGSGNMVTTQNLNDLADKDVSLSNLGGTTLGKALFKIADAAAARTAIGVLPAGTNSDAQGGTSTSVAMTPAMAAARVQGLVAAGGTLTDLTLTYENRLELTFTATSALVFATASVEARHLSTTGTDVFGKLELYDTVSATAVAVNAGGETPLNGTSFGCRFQLGIVHGALTVGRSYKLRLLLAKTVAAGPTYPQNLTIFGMQA